MPLSGRNPSSNPIDEACALVADACARAKAMHLDATLGVSLQRTIGDNTLTFAVQVPPSPRAGAGMGARAAQQQPQAPQFQQQRPHAPMPVPASSEPVGLRPRSNSTFSEEPSLSVETMLLLAELERLKRKALSRGVNLAAQDDDVPAEDVARLRALFSLADSTGSGSINVEELQGLHKHLGEPLEAGEAEEQFRQIDRSGAGSISFDDFLSWYTVAHSRSGLLSKKGHAYNQRFKKLMASIEGVFDVKNVRTLEVGALGTLEYRLQFHYDDSGVLKQLSPWHDIPLACKDGNIHFVCEIPMWTRRKLEIATGEEFNPVKQATRRGKPMEYTYGDLLFNYGAFPQTWADPKLLTDVGEPQYHSGDNDPIDAIELGTMQLRTGSVSRVKVLGAIAMIEAGEVDWKVLCLNTEDPYASRIHDLDDLERVFPMAVSAMRDWFRVGYDLKKEQQEQADNQFAFGGKPVGREQALKIVSDAHHAWQELTTTGQKTL